MECPMSKKSHLLLNSTAGFFGAATLAYAGYVATSWLQYGRFLTGAPVNPLLDRFLPQFEIDEKWEEEVKAPVEVTHAAALQFNLLRSPISRLIFRTRELLLGGRHEKSEAAKPFREAAREIGWVILSEVPGRSIVFAAVTKPWESNPHFIGLGPEEFKAFNDPGFVKIIFSIETDPLMLYTSVFRTCTRVATTDREARRRFRLYWAFLSVGIRIIRREILRLVKSEAERKAVVPAR